MWKKVFPGVTFTDASERSLKIVLIGIAGKTGSGKNYVASLLEDRGWRTLDLDIVAHRALDALASEISARLGTGILDEKGQVDRKELGHCVFADPLLLEWLESLTYPWIEKDARKWIAEDPQTPAAIHAVNLHKTELQHELNGIIWVRASSFTRKRRVVRRDNRSWTELKGRFRSQNGLNSKLFSPDAEIYSVRNSGNHRSLNRNLEKILRRL